MPGRLFYLMGASGAGKDSLLRAARPELTERGCKIAPRVLTRAAESIDEIGAQAVSEERFRELECAGAFAMSWKANGFAYGIPQEIDHWLAAGTDVLVNGSRGYWPQAQRRYPQAIGVLVEVDAEELRRRLVRRGRESEAQIEARLARNALFRSQAGELQRVDNSGPLADGVARLLALID